MSLLPLKTYERNAQIRRLDVTATIHVFIFHDSVQSVYAYEVVIEVPCVV